MIYLQLFLLNNLIAQLNLIKTVSKTRLVTHR